MKFLLLFFFCFQLVFEVFSQTCPVPPACTHTNETDFNFSNGNVLCITTSNFNFGNLDIGTANGETGTLYIAPGASVNLTNLNGGVSAGGTFNVINHGTWNKTGDFNIPNNMIFNNCETGTLNITGSIQVNTNSTLNNLGTINTVNLTNNSDGYIYNSGVFNVSGNFISNSVVCGPDIGCGRFVVDGNSTNNATGGFGIDGVVQCGNLDVCSAGGIGFGSQTGDLGDGASACHPDAATGCGVTLPVELISFKTEIEANDILITWKTTSETNNDYFLIERSLDGVSFKTIGRIEGNGTVSTTKKYKFLDTEAQEGFNYYRLNQVDYDNTSNLSKIIVQEFAPKLNLKLELFPNPNQGRELYLKIKNIKDKKELKVKIYNAQGKQVFKKDLLVDNKKIKIVKQLANGIYFVELVGEGLNFKETLIIN